MDIGTRDEVAAGCSLLEGEVSIEILALRRAIVPQLLTAMLYVHSEFADKFANVSIDKPLLDETRTPSHSLPMAILRGGGVFFVPEDSGRRRISATWRLAHHIVSRNGMWRFDSKAGSDEIWFRRIGENEVTAIGMCDTLVTAETHPGSDSEADRLVKTLLPQVESASKPLPLHGYYFHILSKSGGVFAAVAYPVEYRSSGVMTSYHSDATWTPAESKP